MPLVTSIEQLEAIYGPTNEASLVKVSRKITPEYRALIEASPFVVLATAGPEGLDASPRGDTRGNVVRIHDDTTLMLPDRRGNNRVDSLRNIVRDPRTAFLFLIPGSGMTLRVNGRSQLSIDPKLLESFAVEGNPPRSVIVFAIEEMFFQCARAIVRSELWNPALHADPRSLPSAGQILASMSEERVGGAEYDRQWSDRAKKTLW